MSGNWYTWAGLPISGGITTGWAGATWQTMPLVCEACGNEIKDGDHVSLQIGKDEYKYFHKTCFIDPDTQELVKNLIVWEDLVGEVNDTE